MTPHLPFAYRPDPFIPADQLPDTMSIGVQLHRVIKSLQTPDIPAVNADAMAYFGELLEELNYRPFGKEIQQQIYLGLADHAAQKGVIGPLLCLRAITVGEPQQRLWVQKQAERLLDRFADTVDLGGPEKFGDWVEKAHTVLEHPPVRPIHDAISPIAQEAQAQADLLVNAKEENHPLFSGLLGVRTHRLKRLTQRNSPDDVLQKIEEIAARLEQDGVSQPLLVLGMAMAGRGESNPLLEAAQRVNDRESSATLLPMVIQHLPPSLRKPDYCQPTHAMSNVELLRSLKKLAQKTEPTSIDVLRMGELLETINAQRHEVGRSYLKHHAGQMIGLAQKAENAEFLVAIGQVLTPLDEPLVTLPQLEALPEVLQMTIEPDMLIGCYMPLGTRQECEERLDYLVEEVQEGERVLLAMELQRYAFIRGFEKDADLHVMYDKWMRAAYREDNEVGLHAVGYVMTPPGQAFVNAQMVQAKSAALGAISEQVTDYIANHADEVQRQRREAQDKLKAQQDQRADRAPQPGELDKINPDKGWITRYGDEVRKPGWLGLN